MEFTYEKVSNYAIEETIDRVKAELSKVGFGVLWELNFKDKLKEKGFDYPNQFWVFEVCNPSKAIKVLEKNQKAGYFLPCKVAVYENEESVFAGLMKPSQMINMIDSLKNITDLALEVEQQLTEAIKKAVI